MRLRTHSLLLPLDDLFTPPSDQNAATVVQPVLRTEVLTALVNAGIAKDSIFGIEARAKTKYYVVFEEEEDREANLGTKLLIREKEFYLRHPHHNNNTTSRTREPK